MRICTVELHSYKRTGGGHPPQGPWKDKVLLLQGVITAEMGVITARMQRELQRGCSVGRKAQQQHECRGSCRTDVTVVVVEPWVVVHDAEV